jgi:hypothetical protein
MSPPPAANIEPAAAARRTASYSIGPKTGIGFRKARCVDSTPWSVLCASEWTHGALTPVHLHEAGERCFSYLPVPAFVCSRFESHRQAACAFGRSEMWRLCNTSGCIQEDEAVKQWQGIRRATANSVDPRRDCRESFMIEWRLCNTSGCIQEDEAVKQWQGIRRATANSVDPRRDCRERFMIEKGGNADRFQVFTLAALQVSRV